MKRMLLLMSLIFVTPEMSQAQQTMPPRGDCRMICVPLIPVYCPRFEFQTRAVIVTEWNPYF